MKTTRVMSIMIHLGIAIAALGVLYGQYSSRQDDVDRIRTEAHYERDQTQRMENQVSVQQEILGGIRDGDPFVVDLLARERLNLDRPGELSPPPLSIVDKPKLAPNK